MARKLALVVVLIAAALAAFHFLSGDAAIDRAARAGDATSGSASPSDDLAPVAVDVDAGAARQSVAEGGAASEAEPAAETAEANLAAAASPSTARIRGVVLRHDRTPCEGARVTMLGGPRTQESVERYGAPRTWKQLECSTAYDGSFAFEFEPPAHYHFSLIVSAPMAPDIILSGILVEPNGVRDLGTLVMGLGGRIELRVVRPDGSPATGRWSAWTQDSWVSPLRDNAQIGHGAASNGVDNVIVFAGLAPGACEIKVESVVDTWKTTCNVRVAPGEVVRQDVVYDGGADLGRRLVVHPYTRKVNCFGPPAPEHARLVDVSGAEVNVRAEIVEGTLVWNDLTPGEYTLSIDDPRFQPVDGIEVATGDAMRAAVVPSVSVVCRATSAVDGAAVTGLRVTLVEITGASVGEKRQRELGVSTEERPTEVELLTTSDAQVWSVEAPGFMPQRVEFARGFEPRASATVDVVLEAARMIRGRVVRANGAPVEGCLVKARAVNAERPPPGDNEAERNWLRANQQLEQHECRSDADGSFALGHLVGDSFDVCTRHDARVCGFATAVNAPMEDLVLVLEPHGRLEGRITPVPADLSGVRIYVESLPSTERLPRRFAGLGGGSSRAELQPDGSFTLEVLPAGVHTLTVQLPGVRIDRRHTVAQWGAFDMEPIPFTITEGGTTEVLVDAAASQPREARVRVVDTAHTGTSLLVEGWFWNAEIGDWRMTALGLLGADEVARVAPFKSGRWRFVLSATDGTWSHALPGEFEVRDGEDFETAFEVALVRGRVALEDASGSRLADEYFWFEDGWEKNSFPSDHEGVIELCMPAGTYAFGRDFDIDQESQKFVLVGRFEVVWTTTGPRDPVVVVPDEK